MFLEATERQNLGHAFDRLERILDHPVGNLAQFDERPLTCLVHEPVIHDDTETSRNRPHLWRPEPLGYGFARFAEAFANHLPGKIDVSAILEIDVDNGQAKIRSGADFLHLGQAGHGRLDRIGHIAFDLFRRKAFGLREDLDQ